MAEVQTQPTIPSSTGEGGLPEYKTLGKVLSIPLVNESLVYAYSVISANPYTAYVYNTSLGLGTTAFEYSKPVQARLAPIIDKADGIALRGLDAVESRFPYPFNTTADDVSRLSACTFLSPSFWLGGARFLFFDVTGIFLVVGYMRMKL